MEQLLGKKIIIYSDAGGTERQDIGILQSVEGIWVCIKKGEAELMFFSAHKIRLVKAFDS